MNGYIGQRAKRRKLNRYLFLIGIILLVSIYFSPSIKLEDTVPSNSLFPSKEEMTESQSKESIDNLRLQIFDKEQKIFFRDNQIKKLKENINKLNIEKKKLSNSIVELNNFINLDVLQNNQKKIGVLEGGSNDLEQLNKKIKDLSNENIKLKKSLKNNINDNNLLNQTIKIIESKNLKLNKEQDILNIKIEELKLLIIKKFDN